MGFALLNPSYEVLAPIGTVQETFLLSPNFEFVAKAILRRADQVRSLNPLVGTPRLPTLRLLTIWAGRPYYRFDAGTAGA